MRVYELPPHRQRRWKNTNGSAQEARKRNVKPFFRPVAAPYESQQSEVADELVASDAVPVADVVVVEPIAAVEPAEPVRLEVQLPVFEKRHRPRSQAPLTHIIGGFYSHVLPAARGHAHEKITFGLLWCNQGCRDIERFPEDYANVSLRPLARQLGRAMRFLMKVEEAKIPNPDQLTIEDDPQ